jgi:sulfur-oxidizing protein SoxA
MKKVLTIAATLGLIAGATSIAVQASPQQDLKEFRAYFAERFPDVPFKDYVNGVYAIDQASREQWESIEEFPPYELNIDKGKEAFETAFKNGKTYASCFRNDGIGIKQDYPFYDTAA